MLRIEINDVEVESAIKERSSMLHADPETVLIRAAAESLGLPKVAQRYTDLLEQSHRRVHQVAVPA